ncbi:glycerophosphodiester phosphodiesterase 1-like isoform X3 [Acanthaster planci]|uniref:Glycerophosphodiester phosphodiesterase 1-like isoform X3 n=1 Tax=Acanthaster planci TaxID=133434 RepID=A0A8B8A0M6_ACAPL|nr:glycerophosphodiester phosphodiesterase 1-like isoform X3 [Acanthaster planci]
MRLQVYLSCLVNFFTAFSLIFCPSLMTCGWLISVAWCFWIAVTLLIASVISLLMFRLQRPNDRQIEAFFGNDWPSVSICHRGGAAEAPENTTFAFREANKNGSKFVEFDVGLTKDGVPVLLHDDSVDRTTNGTGALKNLTLAEVLKLNAAAKHPLREKFPQASIPTLEEATVECLSLGLNIFFDVKDWSTEVRRQDPAILTALTTCTNLIQFEFGCDMTGPLWKRSLCILGDYLLLWSQSAWLWILCGNAATLLDKKIVTENIVDYWAQRGTKTVVWTVNDKIEKEYFHRCLQCGVITDSVQAS